MIFMAVNIQIISRPQSNLLKDIFLKNNIVFDKTNTYCFSNND